ncbi:peptide chain release factor N(5)-glutamine methyltransferase [Oceanibium sediminis]|uniref:peptide chain release factor N(5)-glutamine methyltransferase n=1 Tax=Oceanibium sediminis TaxID=2026339 RepID=UPI000DD3462A|nr:peptide chain release factor N(5)-glutamine methyltransferase [Oceanibium sediminis]
MSETIQAALVRATALLDKAGIPDAARDARALVADAADLPPDRLRLEAAQTLGGAQAERLQQHLSARIARQPVAQILGERLFWGRSFHVTRDVLDPRPETELIVARALAGSPPERVLDLGTGSGILAVTVLAECPGATGVASDLSAPALAVASRNAARHGVGDRLRSVQGSWFAPVDGVFDLILSNPPYIPQDDIPGLSPDVREWEPHLALTPGGDGLGPYRAMAAGMTPHLAPEGRALFEFGQGQADAVCAIFRSAGWENLEIHKDMSEKSRVLEVKNTAPGTPGA